VAAPSRDEALGTLGEGYRGLLGPVEGVPEDDLTRPATIGDGKWSAKDLVVHVAIWEEASIDALAAIRRGGMPSIEAYLREGAPGIDRYNDETMSAIRDLTWRQALARAEAAHVTLTGAIRTMTDDEWTARVPYDTERRKRLAELLASITGAPKRPFGHAFAHIPDLEAFVVSLP
jgi:hypothetical protein